MSTLLFIAALAVGAAFWMYFASNAHDHKHHGRYPTFDEYKVANPGLVRPGRVECVKCGGTNIQARGLDSAVDLRRTHHCATCGTVLYKSEG